MKNKIILCFTLVIITMLLTACPHNKAGDIKTPEVAKISESQKTIAVQKTSEPKKITEIKKTIKPKKRTGGT
jgi:hypothetical protein